METVRMRRAIQAGWVVMAATLGGCGGSDDHVPTGTVLAPSSASQLGGDAGGSSLQANAPALAAAPAHRKGHYSIINLGPSAVVARINRRGQAAFDYAIQADGKSAFFDGDQITEIGQPGAEDTFITAMNHKGEVVGWTRILPTDALHAYRWKAGAGLTILPYYSADSNSYAGDINRHGEVVGMSGLPPPPEQAYRATRWSAANVLTSLAPVGFGESLASDNNDANASVGYAVAADDNAHAFIWDAANNATDLGTFGGDSAVGALINRHGEIGGLIHTGEGLDRVSRAYLWNSTDGLATVTPVGESSNLRALNDAGQAVGQTFSLDSQITYALKFSRSQGLVNLHDAAFERSAANDINGSGVTVGWMGSSGDSGFDSRAYLWSGASAVDLNSRLHNAPDGLVLTEALAISAQGDILANSNAGLVMLRGCGCGTNAPVLGPVMVAPPQVGVASAMTLSFRDRNMGQTHTATVDWGDGAGPQPATVSQGKGAGTVSASHTYTSQGAFTITVRVTDSGGRSTAVIHEVSLIDLFAASISGQGSIAGARGADRGDTAASRSPLNFMLAAPLQPARGSAGAFRFRLQGGLRFDGETLSSVRRSGATVRLEGTGRLNGRSGYHFIVEATDGSAASQGGADDKTASDRLAIRISHLDRGGKQRIALDYGTAASTPAPLARVAASSSSPVAGMLPGRTIQLRQ